MHAAIKKNNGDSNRIYLAQNYIQRPIAKFFFNTVILILNQPVKILHSKNSCNHPMHWKNDVTLSNTSCNYCTSPKNNNQK